MELVLVWEAVEVDQHSLEMSKLDFAGIKTETNDVCHVSDPILVSDGMKEYKIMLFPTVSAEDLMLISDFGKAGSKEVAAAMENLEIIPDGQAVKSGEPKANANVKLQMDSPQAKESDGLMKKNCGGPTKTE